MARLGLGLAAIGRPAYITSGRAADLAGGRSRDDLLRRAHELLDRAYASGVRYVDAARSYGDAERFLGSWLAARDVPDVFVASKWGYRYVGDWRMDAERHEVKSHDLATFTTQLAETTALLGDRLRLYQIHSVTPGGPALTDRPLLAALADLRDRGVEIGVSTSGPAQAAAIAEALAVEVGGRRLISSVQSTWNLLEPSAGAALAAAHDAGVRVVVKEAVANGRLAPGGDAAPALAEPAARHGVDAAAVALGAVHAQPWCDVVLSGAVTTDQLVANAAPARLTPDELATLGDLAEPAERYWAARSARPWT